MSLNSQRLRQQVKKAISINPTHIDLKRIEKISNGMRGSKDQEISVASVDVLIDDSKHQRLLDIIKDSGTMRISRGINMVIVTEGYEIKLGDYFQVNEVNYRVTYPGKLVEGIYEADLEVIS